MKTLKEQTQNRQEKQTGKHKTIKNPWYKYQLKNA